VYKHVSIIFVLLLMFSCASTSSSTKFYWDLNYGGLERLLNYQGKTFIFLPEETKVNQFEINNFQYYTLNSILVDRNNPTTCTFSFENENGEISTVTLNIRNIGKNNSQNNNDLPNDYVVCISKSNGDYYVMNYYEIVNFSNPNKFTGRNIQNIAFYDSSIFVKGFHSLESITNEINKYNSQRATRSQNRSQQGNTNKLFALLLNPYAAGQFGQFTRGEVVNIPRAFLRVIDLQQSGNTYSFLVMVNDNNINKPFYIIANRMLNLMDISYRNTIFEDIVIQYVGTDDYLSSGVPRETFVFQLSQ